MGIELEKVGPVVACPPLPDTAFEPAAYRGKDGMIRTVVGSARGIIVFDGKLTAGTLGERWHRFSVTTVDELVFGSDRKPLVPIGTTTVAAIRAAAGKPVPGVTVTEQETKCKECGGSGLTVCWHCEQDMDCEECKGDGVIVTKTHTPWPNRYVRVAGSMVHGVYLANLIEMVADGFVDVFAGKDLIVYAGDGWRIAQADATTLVSDGDEVTELVVIPANRKSA